MTQWRLDGQVHTTARTAPSCVYALALNRLADYHTLAAAGSMPLVECFFGAYERATLRFAL